MRLDEVRADDAAALAEWSDVLADSAAVVWPDEPAETLEEITTLARQQDGPLELRHVLARDGGGRALGALRVALPRYDNPHLAEVDVEVRPAARGRGVGSALVAEAERIAGAAGRSHVLAQAALRRPNAATARALERFATGRGYRCAQRALRGDLRLPAPGLAAIGEEAALAAPEMRLVGWLDRCPEELLADRAEIARRMSTDPPWGEVAHGEENWDADRARREQELALARGFRVFGAGALDPSGRLVACTELWLREDAPAVAWQGDTLVLSEARGRRLGLRVKVANLAALAGFSPGTVGVRTWNAAENTFMLAVNARLGFRTIADGWSWQKQLVA